MVGMEIGQAHLAVCELGCVTRDCVGQDEVPGLPLEGDIVEDHEGTLVRPHLLALLSHGLLDGLPALDRPQSQPEEGVPDLGEKVGVLCLRAAKERR